MTLGNSPRQLTVLTLEARKSFAFGLQFQQKSDGAAVDLTGATVRFTLAQPDYLGGTQLLERDATLVDAVGGQAQIALQAVDLDQPEDEYPFAVTLLDSTGYSTLILKGVVDLRDNADTLTTGTYAGTNPTTQLAAYLNGGGTVTVELADLGVGPEGPQGQQGPRGLQGIPGPRGPAGANGADGLMTSVQPGSGIDVDATDPANPVVAVRLPAILLDAGQTVAQYEAANGVAVTAPTLVFRKA